MFQPFDGNNKYAFHLASLVMRQFNNLKLVNVDDGLNQKNFVTIDFRVINSVDSNLVDKFVLDSLNTAVDQRMIPSQMVRLGMNLKQ